MNIKLTVWYSLVALVATHALQSMEFTEAAKNVDHPPFEVQHPPFEKQPPFESQHPPFEKITSSESQDWGLNSGCQDQPGGSPQVPKK